MKRALTFLLGILVGFILAGPLPGTRDDAVSPVELTAKSEPVLTGGEGAPPVADTGLSGGAGAEIESVDPVLPAADRPAAFNFRFLRSNISPWERARFPQELLEDPEFEALLQRVWRADLRESLAEYRKLVPLSEEQFEAIVELGVEQNLEYFHADTDQVLSATEQGKAGRTQLESFLSADQMERLAELKYADSYYPLFELAYELPVRRGLPPLTLEQLDRLLVPDTWHASNGPRSQDIYARLRLEIGVDDPSLTPAQRDFLTTLDRYHDDSALLSAVGGASVRDPEVWEIWPED